MVLGVDGQATSGITGVTTTDLYSLRGRSTYPSGYGVLGEGDGHGVHGYGGTSGTGVYGYGVTGVYGYGNNGNGVFGQTSVNATSGVYGQNDGTGYGVAGRSNNGTGVLADSINGTALLVTGKAAFSRSGKATVKAGNSQVVVKNVALTSSSLILATLQQVEAGIAIGSRPSVISTAKSHSQFGRQLHLVRDVVT